MSFKKQPRNLHSNKTEPIESRICCGALFSFRVAAATDLIPIWRYWRERPDFFQRISNRYPAATRGRYFPSEYMSLSTWRTTPS
jgi:hypothetical protein